MTLFEEVERAQAHLDRAYARLLEIRTQARATEALRMMHGAAEDALSEARSLVQLLEQISSEASD